MRPLGVERLLAHTNCRSAFFRDLGEVERRLFDFERRYEQAAKPFEWKFTRRDLAQLLRRLGLRAAA